MYLKDTRMDPLGLLLVDNLASRRSRWNINPKLQARRVFLNSTPNRDLRHHFFFPSEQSSKLAQRVLCKVWT